MRRRGPNYLNALRRDLGETAESNAIVITTRLIATTEDLDLGGRVLSLRAWPTAHAGNGVSQRPSASQLSPRSAVTGRPA